MSDSENPFNALLFDEAKILRKERKEPLIAIVDDDENIRELAQAVLRERYHTTTAMDGFSALNLYSKAAPDLVFLDINMPGMDGLTVLQQLVDYDPESCIVMFSAHSTKNKIKMALEIGAKGFVTKPFTPLTLFNYAEKMLDKAKGNAP